MDTFEALSGGNERAQKCNVFALELCFVGVDLDSALLLFLISQRLRAGIFL